MACTDAEVGALLGPDFTSASSARRGGRRDEALHRTVKGLRAAAARVLDAPRRGRYACGAALIAEMSKFSFTLSLTMTPPVSSAAFQVRPQSERRISALPSKPTRSLP